MNLTNHKDERSLTAMRRLRNLLVLTIILTSTSTLAYSQKRIGDEFDADFKSLVARITAIKNSGDPLTVQETKIRTEFDELTHTDVFGLALAIAVAPRERYVKKIEDARVDKQVGASAAASGTTTLVSKGSVPSILGLAVENGGLQKTTSGTTITFRGNPIGIIKALGDKGFIQSYDDDDATTRVLRRFSFGVSFDTSRGTQPGTFTGDQQQISSYSLRFDLYNKRDPRHSSYRRKWDSLISNKGQAFTQDASRILAFFNPGRAEYDPQLGAWKKSAQDAVIGASAKDVENVLKEQLGDKLKAVQLRPELKAVVESFEANVNSYLADRGNLLKEVANGPIVTFDFTNNRPGNQPNYSNFDLIGEFSPFDGRADLTTNASFSTFDKKPSGPGAKTARDFQLSAQLDVPLGDIAKTGPFVFTMSGKYQHVFSDITTTGATPTTLRKGDIGIGQLKFTIPVKGSGVKIPLSVTFSNRNEFIKESRIRGNIGLTFDLDSIFSRLKP
jgi:hypothetical protein